MSMFGYQLIKGEGTMESLREVHQKNSNLHHVTLSTPTGTTVTAIGLSSSSSAVGTGGTSTNKLTSFGSPGSAFSSSPAHRHTPIMQLCCLTEDGERCGRAAGNASYSKRVQKTVQQKKLRLNIDGSARHVYICDYHKNMIQSVRACVKRKRKDSADEPNEMGTRPVSNSTSSDHPQVDLSTLQMNTLRRYKRHYRVQTRPGINKSELAETLLNHFKDIEIDEKEAITYFIYMVKCHLNKLDQMHGLAQPNSNNLPDSSSLSPHNAIS